MRGELCRRSTDCEGTAVLRANEWGYYRGFWVCLSSKKFCGCEEVPINRGYDKYGGVLEKNYNMCIDSILGSVV